jgi:glycine hydroxymethyltransferase
VLTNKYAEGLPGKRYYGGCEFVDRSRSWPSEPRQEAVRLRQAPTCSRTRARRPTAVYLAALKPGDAILTLDLSHGGHLTHGSPVNSSGLTVQGRALRVDVETGRIDWTPSATSRRPPSPR